LVPPPEKLTNLQSGASYKTSPIRGATAKGIDMKFTMVENQQPGPSNETKPPKKIIIVISDKLLEEKEVFVPPPEQSTNLQFVQSCISESSSV